MNLRHVAVLYAAKDIQTLILKVQTPFGIGQMINMHWPGIEPGSTAWKAAMLTTIPPMPHI